MRTITKIDEALSSRPGFIHKPINETSAKDLFNSNEEFLVLASKAGMVEVEDYVFFPNGIIQSTDRSMEKLINFMAVEWREKNEEAKENLIVDISYEVDIHKSDDIIFRILQGDFIDLHTYSHYMDDKEPWLDDVYIEKIRKAGLIQDKDFVLLFDAHGELINALITQEGWNRFIEKYPEYDRNEMKEGM